MKKTLLCFLLLFPFSCKKQDTPITPPTTPVVTATGFQLSKAKAMPLEVLTVTLDEPSEKKTLEAKIGSLLVSWQQIDNNTYGFLIPENLAPGSYDVAITNSSKTVPLMITTALAVPDPITYGQDLLKQASLQIERAASIQDSLVKQNLLSTAAADQEHLARQKKLADATAQFNALSSQDKKRAAQFIAANRSSLDSLNMLLSEFGPLAPASNGRMVAKCPLGITDEYAQCAMRKLILLATITATSGYGLLLSAETLQLPAFVLFFITYGLAVNELKDLMLYNVALAIVYSNQATIQLKAERQASADDFKNGIAKVVTYRIPLRNIQEDLDKNSPNATVRELVSTLQKLRTIFGGKVGDLLGVKFNFAPLKTEFILPEVLSKLSVSVLNNPNVTGTISKFNKGFFNLTFATNQKTSQTFDYKINYLFGDTPVEKTVTTNQLVVPVSQVDLSDCSIITTNGVPIIKAGEAGIDYVFSLAGSCKFPLKTLFSWNFGDGTPDVVEVDNSAMRHTFKTAGQYTVKLKVLLDSQLDYLNFASIAQIGQAGGDYYFTYQANGTTYTFESVYAQYLGGRFDIVGDGNKIQAGIFFSPASLVSKGASLNKFVYHCTPTTDRPDKYVLGSHLYNFNTQKPIATTYSRNAIWGCDASQPADNETPGQLIIFQNDGNTIEGMFEYTDYVSKQPVSGKFKVPIKK